MIYHLHYLLTAAGWDCASCSLMCWPLQHSVVSEASLKPCLASAGGCTGSCFSVPDQGSRTSWRMGGWKWMDWRVAPSSATATTMAGSDMGTLQTWWAAKGGQHVFWIPPCNVQKQASNLPVVPDAFFNSRSLLRT